MTLWVLDTDSLSLLERGNPQIQERLSQVTADSVAISIVTAEEKMKGRLAAINSLSGIERIDRLAIAYRDLQSSITFGRLRQRRSASTTNFALFRIS